MGVGDDAIWQRRWRRLAAQSENWYETPSGAVGCRFTANLAVECQGVCSRSWNSKIPLVFAHVVLTKTMSVRRSKKILSWITRQMDLWERGLHAGLLGDAKSEGASREVSATSGR